MYPLVVTSLSASNGTVCKVHEPVPSIGALDIPAEDKMYTDVGSVMMSIGVPEKAILIQLADEHGSRHT
jgi:hypothetical protein